MNIKDIKEYLALSNSYLSNKDNSISISELLQKNEEFKKFLSEEEKKIISNMNNYHLIYSSYDIYNITFKCNQHRLKFSYDNNIISVNFSITDIKDLQPYSIQNEIDFMKSIYNLVYNLVTEYFDVISLNNSMNHLSKKLQELDVNQKNKFIFENINQSLKNEDLTVIQEHLKLDHKLYSIVIKNNKLDIQSHLFRFKEDNTISRMIDYIDSHLRINDISTDNLSNYSIKELELIIQYSLMNKYNNFVNQKFYYDNETENEHDSNYLGKLDQYIKDEMNYIKEISKCKETIQIFVDDSSYPSLESITQKFLFLDNKPITYEDAKNIIKLPLDQLYELTSIKTNLKDF